MSKTFKEPRQQVFGAKIPSKTALFKAYQSATTPGLKRKEVNRIIKYTVQDPESSAADALIRIARKGDADCAKAIAPLMDIFWDGDFEWQEAIVGLLGELAHLSPDAVRVRVAQFLGHIAVSMAFVGGSGVDGAALNALSRIGANCAAIFRANIPKNKVVIFDGRHTFESEAGE